MIQIDTVKAENFKGFRNFELHLGNNYVVILGGKNGYGKTTFFDIIELVFTGKIKRYESYISDFHDQRTNLNEDVLPLVFDNKISEIKVEVKIRIDNKIMWLKREAKTTEMHNPISFLPFARLYFKEKDDDDYILATNDFELNKNSVFTNYDFLHYLDQEECTLLLKTKEKDRSNKISTLFNTQSFDNDLEKVYACEKSLKRIKEQYIAKIEEYTRTKKAIEEYPSFETINKDDIQYIKLTKNNNYIWDNENPELSDEEFFNLLSQNGIIENLIYYINNEDVYKKHKINEWIKKQLVPEELKKIGVYLFHQEQEYYIELFKTYQKEIEIPFKKLTIDNLSSFSFDYSENLRNIIGHKQIETLKEQIDPIINTFDSLSEIKQDFSKLQNERDNIIKSLNCNSLIDLSYCPLCGKEFDTHDALIFQINEFEKALLNHSDSLLPILKNQFELFIDNYKRLIINYFELIFSQRQINNEIVSFYDKRTGDKIRYLQTYHNIDISKAITIEEQIEKLKLALQACITDEDDTIDYELLKKTDISYINNMNMDVFSLTNLQIKQQYLIHKWNIKRSSTLVKYYNLLNQYNKYLGFCDERLRKIKQLKSDIQEQKNTYLKKLISDIEILFYVYSGRIMQDCFYGRGLFLKRDDNGKRIIFISGNYNNDVDALYNMSSGQLTSVIIALTLALNKLYADTSLIAIDDPLQTIDDMNFWGLIETIRHEFNDYNILLSTHEIQYGSLLKYKTEKLGMRSHYFDMADIRNNDHN